MEAVRHALFAERLGPVLMSLEDVLEVDMAGLTASAKGKVAVAKMQARTRIGPLRATLMLDEPVG